MKLIFVRHGKSLANANSTIGVPDTKLAEEGIEQARITGQDLKAKNVAAIVCSPFIRAQQTAEIIAGELGIPLHDITIIEELHERRMGELEGQPKRHESAFFHENDTDFGFESQADLISRVGVALQKIKTIAQQTKGSIVVVGHAVSGLYMQQVAQGKLRLEDFDHTFHANNAEFIELEVEN